MKRKIFLFSLLALYINISYSQQGKNGTLLTTGNIIVNEYTSLTNDASTGNSSITVNSSSLNINNRFATPLDSGDLIMIIQMQGATINGNATDSTWGEITNYNNCGLYEFAEVVDVPNLSTINLGCGLKNNYTSSGRVQIVRVPRFTTVTVNDYDTLKCDQWNGSVGGVLVAEIMGNLAINSMGAIDASGMGFRGGELINITAFNNNPPIFFSTTQNDGGQKGESIAGYQTDYNAFGGMFSRGAPANAGGGGNCNSTSGGGGANAGNINGWTGNGNPDISNPSWIAAWNLEYNGFAFSTSSGGGRGGYGHSSKPLDPLTNAPGSDNWGFTPNGDIRANLGGKGGRPLDYSTGRLFFGGGGGAGYENDNAGGAGGTGGGIVYILSYGDIKGAGIVANNGSNGKDGPTIGYGDGVGGGGAGGTILLNSTGTVTGISVYANGGDGGNQLTWAGGGSFAIEAEGGGAGGGGGYIAVSNGNINRQAKGGANGITNSTYMYAAFPANGATKGGDGLANEVINSISISSLPINISPNVTICLGANTSLFATGGNNYSWTPISGLNNSSISNPSANPTVTTTYTVTVTSSACSATATVVISIDSAVFLKKPIDTTICRGSAVLVVPLALATNSYLWSPSSGLSCTNCYTPVANPSVTTTYTLTISDGNCTNSDSAIVRVRPPLSVNTPIDTTICIGSSVKIYPSDSSSYSYIWSPSVGLSCTNCSSPLANPDTTTTYTIIVSNQYCLDTLNALIRIGVKFKAGTVTALRDTICDGSPASLSVSGSTGKIQWQSSVTSGNYINILGSGDSTYIFIPHQTANYRIIAGNGSCADTSSAYQLVVMTSPVANFTYSALGREVTFSSNGSSGDVTIFEWDFGDGDQSYLPNPIQTYSSSDTFHVCLTVYNGSNCSFTICKDVTVGYPAGIGNIFHSETLNIYPNPFHNFIFIEKKEKETKVLEIEIYNVLGKRALYKTVGEKNLPPFSVDVSSLTEGLYFIKIKTTETNFIQEIIKQ